MSETLDVGFSGSYERAFRYDTTLNRFELEP